jgi:hypothetical protein
VPANFPRWLFTPQHTHSHTYSGRVHSAILVLKHIQMEPQNTQTMTFQIVFAHGVSQHLSALIAFTQCFRFCGVIEWVKFTNMCHTSAMATLQVVFIICNNISSIRLSLNVTCDILDALDEPCMDLVVLQTIHKKADKHHLLGCALQVGLQQRLPARTIAALTLAAQSHYANIGKPLSQCSCSVCTNKKNVR